MASSPFKTLLLGLSFAFVASTSPAETLITLHPPGDPAGVATSATARNASATGSFGGRANLQTALYIVPLFEVDADSLSGTTTLFSVRAEPVVMRGMVGTALQMRYYPTDSFTPFEVEDTTLSPNEVFSRNVRDILDPMATGTVSGYVEIEANGPITADYFQVIPAEDFATGGIPFDLGNDLLCDRWRARFLIGGGFSGGTGLTLLVNGPRGMSEPSAGGSAYTESGTLINTFNITTDQIALKILAQDFVLPGNNFGSMTLEFDSEFGGGAVVVNHDASGRYSVGLPGHCLDAAPILLR